VTACIQSRVRSVADGVALLYAEHPVEDASHFADFHVGVHRPRTWRRWFRPQVVFSFDGETPFNALPGDQGLPMLEWGLNWCISAFCHQYLVLHAAVLAKGDACVVIPAPSGSGKSTLTAGLAFAGWRLLSDELALIEPRSTALVPLVRPISLKNASIDVIRQWAPQATLSPPIHDTVKGVVAHVKPPPEAVAQANVRGQARWIVLPQFKLGATTALTPIDPGLAMTTLVENAFNYHVHGRQGFDTLVSVVQQSQAYKLRYGSLQDGVAAVDSLLGRGL
jgi:HprK-related kinase A